MAKQIKPLPNYLWYVMCKALEDKAQCVCDGSAPINDLSASQPESPPDDLPPLCGSIDKHSSDAVAIAIDSPVLSSPLLFFSASEANLKGGICEAGQPPTSWHPGRTGPPRRHKKLIVRLAPLCTVPVLPFCLYEHPSLFYRSQCPSVSVLERLHRPCVAWRIDKHVPSRRSSSVPAHTAHQKAATRRG
jgi:hypothetical protein